MSRYASGTRRFMGLAEECQGWIVHPGPDRTAPGHGPGAWHFRADYQVAVRATAGRCGRPQVAPTEHATWATAGRPYWPHRSRPFPRWRFGFVHDARAHASQPRLRRQKSRSASYRERADGAVDLRSCREDRPPPPSRGAKASMPARPIRSPPTSWDSMGNCRESCQG